MGWSLDARMLTLMFNMMFKMMVRRMLILIVVIGNTSR